MDFISQLAASVLMLFASVTGAGGALQADEPVSVAGGVYEASPKGEAGGFAIPASGCSPADPRWHGYPIHDCAVKPEIKVDKPIIRYGETVVVDWDPRTHTGCEVAPFEAPVPNGAVAGSEPVQPTGEITFTIICDGVGNEDAATVKVLPRIQET